MRSTNPMQLLWHSQDNSSIFIRILGIDEQALELVNKPIDALIKVAESFGIIVLGAIVQIIYC